MDRNVKQNGWAVAATVIVIAMAFFAIPNRASAQGTPPFGRIVPRVSPRPSPSPSARVGTTVIRGITYQDHSAGTSLNPNVIPVNGSFSITSSTLNFNTAGTLKVVIQDAARPNNASGVTVFQLRNVRRSGNRLLVQGPAHPIFKNRKFYVTVFLYTSSGNMYASAGMITFQ